MGTVVPLTSQTAPPVSSKLPVAPAYESAWTVPLTSATPVHLSADGTHVFALVDDHRLAAIATDTGGLIWTVNNVSPDARLTGGNGRLYVIHSRQPEHDGQPPMPGRLDVLDFADGHRLWTTGVDVSADVDPLVLTTTILLPAGRQLREHVVTDGSLAWENEFNAAITALTSDADRIFVALANHTVLSIDRRTHARLTETRLESDGIALVSAGRRLFVSSADGSLAAYENDRSDGLLWRVPRVQAIGRPVVDDRHVYVAEFDNTARAYDAGNGTERWRLRLESRPLAGVQIAAGWVYFPLLSGALAIAPTRLRSGQPSSIISSAALPGSGEARMPWGGVTPDGRLLLRLIRPDTHYAWTLVAATRKSGRD